MVCWGKCAPIVKSLEYYYDYDVLNMMYEPLEGGYLLPA
jgi:hypothetical protein